MPNKEAHLQQAIHNEEAANILLREVVFNDWAITALFYAAVHYVEAKVFEKKFEGYEHSPKIPTDSTPHNKRIILIQKHLPEIYGDYNALFEQCRIVRYDCAFTLGKKGKNKPTEYIAKEKVDKLLAKLEKIKNTLGYSN